MRKLKLLTCTVESSHNTRRQPSMHNPQALELECLSQYNVCKCQKIGFQIFEHHCKLGRRRVSHGLRHAQGDGRNVLSPVDLKLAVNASKGNRLPQGMQCMETGQRVGVSLDHGAAGRSGIGADMQRRNHLASPTQSDTKTARSRKWLKFGKASWCTGEGVINPKTASECP